MKLNIGILVIAMSFLMSCGEGEDTISGEYCMTDLQFSGCSDLSAVDLVFDDGGLCLEEDGVYGCVFFCLNFTETSLSINIRATEDGEEVLNLDQSAMFDPDSETIDFCLPNATCDGITVSDDKDRITFSGFDSDLGCDFVLVMERG